MKLENQLTNCKLSMRLKKLGVKQNAVYHYYLDTPTLLGFGLNHKDIVSDKNKCSAFSVAELGEILPVYIKRDADNVGFSIETCRLTIEKINNNSWSVEYLHNHFSSEKLADAMGLMLIHLLENKLIKL